MNTLEGRAWRDLAGAKGVGPKTLWQIADYLSGQNKTASWLLKNPEKLRDALRGSKADIMLTGFADYEYKEKEKLNMEPVILLHPNHPAFPERIRILKTNISLPALLYTVGNIAILSRPAVAIVGKRNACTSAIKAADSLANELAVQGINITSGYAVGIDAAAHLAALRAGGTTSIVLAEGIVHFLIKPELREILTKENTLVISQFDPGAKWAAYMAMTRNKLVGALSGAVVVIASGPERDASGRSSGTFDTGMSALKMGIPVFVVFPDFFAEPPEGNRQLIAKGCREWDPAAGAAPILAALIAKADKNQLPRQLNLFDKNGD
jgi:DNA processing protein